MSLTAPCVPPRSGTPPWACWHGEGASRVAQEDLRADLLYTTPASGGPIARTTEHPVLPSPARNLRPAHVVAHRRQAACLPRSRGLPCLHPGHDVRGRRGEQVLRLLPELELGDRRP